MACISKRRDRWIIDFYDHTGKRRWKTCPKGTTKKRARELMRDIEESVARGTYLPEKRIPFFSEVADMWLIAKKPNIRHSTFGQYTGHVENHLKPYFEGVRINRVNFEMVEKFIADSFESGVIQPTLKKILINLGAIMTYSVRKRYIDYNPVRDVEKPKGQSLHDEKKEMDILNPSEIRALLDAAPDTKHRLIFTIAVSTGLRQGELFGLKWTDIDWFNNQIHVNRTYNHFKFYEPKTVNSRRKVDAPPQTMRALKEWKLACPVNDLNLIFPNEAGKPMSSINMYNRVYLPALNPSL